MPYQRGVTVGGWGTGAYQPERTAALMRTLRRLGVDSVTLLAVWRQEHRRSTRISPDDEATVRTANLSSAIQAARACGMKVVLRPYVDVRDGTWRATLQPADADRWFRDYRRFILRYGRLAHRESVSGFVIGSEMASLSGEADRWRALAAAVRRRFGGFVAYQANWDEQEVEWWDAVDAISVSGYYPVARTARYTVRDLVRGWKEPYGRLERLSRRFDRPVMFGEIGYRSVRGSAQRPWGGGLRGPRDPRAQAVGYAAALRTWRDAPFFAGFQWWYVSPDGGRRGLPGADHQPMEPALRTLARYYRAR